MMKKKRKKNLRKKTKTKELYKGLVVFSIILIVLLVILLIISLFKSTGGDLDEPQLYSIRDECSLVMGNVMHPIQDGGDCKIKCINECEFRGLEIDSFEFVPQNSSCNVCDCYCI